MYIYVDGVCICMYISVYVYGVCICMYHIFPIHSSINRQLDCFHFLVIVNNAVTTVEVQLSL